MSDHGGWVPKYKDNYEKFLKNPPGRHMRYPYTFTAQLVQFPHRFQWNTSYPFRFFIFGAAASCALFYYINGLIMTPANYEQTWKKREEEKHYHYKRP